MMQQEKWSKEARYGALASLIILVIGVLWYFRAVINPLVIAAIMAYITYPIVRFLSTRTRLSHGAAVVIVYILTILVMASAPAMITPVIVGQVRLFTVNFESLATHYAELRSTPVQFMEWVFYPQEFLPDVPQFSADMLSPIAESVFVVVGAVTKNFIWVMVMMISWFYFLQDGHRFGEGIVNIAPDNLQGDIRKLLGQLRFVWADYMRSQLTFMLAVGVVDSIVWLIVGLPGAVMLGFFTGLTSFVHEVGAIVSGVLSVGVALLEGSAYFSMSNFWFAVLVLVLYLILTAVKNFWLRPVIVGRTVHIHPGIVLVSILGALVLHGALAAFLVVPVLLSLWIIAKYLRCRVLGLHPFPADEEFPISELSS
ncbi:MAG: AI-2E family transporter [Anaerolineae bacterium]|nr:AI-2E family transporter [Anaerolineae bacterium]MBL6965513.1 AI-2E family transporter [Anaerolineales bacterium]